MGCRYTTAGHTAMQANERSQGWIQAHKHLQGSHVHAAAEPGAGCHCGSLTLVGMWGQREWEGTQATGICNHDNWWGKSLSSEIYRGSVVALLFFSVFFFNLSSNTQHFLLHLLPYLCFQHCVGQCLSHGVSTVNICLMWLLHESVPFSMCVLMWYWREVSFFYFIMAWLLSTENFKKYQMSRSFYKVGCWPFPSLFSYTCLTKVVSKLSQRQILQHYHSVVIFLDFGFSTSCYKMQCFSVESKIPVTLTALKGITAVAPQLVQCIEVCVTSLGRNSLLFLTSRQI